MRSIAGYAIAPGLAALALAHPPVALNAAATEVRIRSSKDGSEQLAMFFAPTAAAPETKSNGVPLIVSLHSWSTGYAKYDSFASTLKGCQQRGWVFISPHFRGPNNRPEACGSELAVQDVLDSVAFAKAHARVNPRQIFATGASHMTLVLAHRAPEVWAGISAWLPVTDLVAFHRFNQTAVLRFAGMVELACGGRPGRPETDAQYAARSSLPHLAAARFVPIDINVGVRDGHGGGPIPVDQSVRAFNVLARANGHPSAMFSETQIQDMTRSAEVPADLAWHGPEEPARRHRILLRRTAGPTRITVFDEGHVWDEGKNGAAEPVLDWIASILDGGQR